MSKVKVRYTQGGPSQLPQIREEMAKPIDLKESLAAVIAELNAFEQQYGISTVEFYARFKAGLMGDGRDFMKWAGAFDDYQYLLRRYFSQRPEAA